VLIASQPVLTSTYAGPSPGVMMMGRYLNEARVNRLAMQSGVPFTLVLQHSMDRFLPSPVQTEGAVSKEGGCSIR
jgi:sensor domain CHASE-containing protein